MQVVIAGEDANNTWFKQHTGGRAMARLNRSRLWFYSEKVGDEYISQWAGLKASPDISRSVLLTFKGVFVLWLSGAHRKVVYQFCGKTMFSITPLGN